MRGGIIISDFIFKKKQMLEEQMVTNVRHTHTLHPKKQRNEMNFIKKKGKLCLYTKTKISTTVRVFFTYGQLTT